MQNYQHILFWFIYAICMCFTGDYMCRYIFLLCSLGSGQMRQHVKCAVYTVKNNQYLPFYHYVKHLVMCSYDSPASAETAPEVSLVLSPVVCSEKTLQWC